jgi:hypothetical protein
MRASVQESFISATHSLLQGATSSLGSAMLSMVENLTSKPPKEEQISRTWVLVFLITLLLILTTHPKQGDYSSEYLFASGSYLRAFGGRTRTFRNGFVRSAPLSQLDGENGTAKVTHGLMSMTVCLLF